MFIIISNAQNINMKKRKIFALCVIIPSLLIILTNFAIWISPSLALKHSEEYTIYDNNENYAFTYHYNGLAKYLELDKISPHFKDAIICSEDQRFYQHHGLDYRRILASLIDNIKEHDIVAGGSTITQQLARTLYLNNDKTIIRKLKEAILARKIEMSFSKDQILEAYLNSVYFGHNIYGIDEASAFFFNKSPSNLTLAESALLAGIISAPSYYSPDINLEASIKKKEQVLKIMYNKGKITYLDYQNALNEQLNFYFKKKNDVNSHIMYYYDAIKNELNNYNLLKNENKNIGMDIYSSLDLDIMNKITNIVNAFKINEQENQISIVVMRPNSGDVLALVGGVNYETSQFNRAISSFRQTGSTIKLLLYYLALKMGMRVNTKLLSKETNFHLENVGEYSPSNASNTYANKPITMLEAIALSDNIYATKTLLLVGSENLKQLLINLGVPTAVANPTIGLGTNEMTPLQLTAIYNTFASKGNYYEPQIIKKVKLKNNKLVYEKNSNIKYQLDKDITLTLNHLLLSPFDANLSSYTTPSLINYHTKNTFAAKTGSTETDSWVVGFNPHYTITVYVGTDENKPLKNGKLAKELFVSIADSLTKDDSDIFYDVTNKMTAFRLYNQDTKLTSNIYYELN